MPRTDFGPEPVDTYDLVTRIARVVEESHVSR